MKGFLSSKLAKGYNDAENFYRVGNTPFATNAVSIVHAPQGSGKSYATARLCGHEPEMVNVAYLDFDQNSANFRNFCWDNSVEYVNMSNISISKPMAKKIERDMKRKGGSFKWPEQLPMELLQVCNVVSADDTLIIDSLASMMPDSDVMSTKISSIFYDLAEVAKHFKITIIVIDHSTEIRNKDGKVVDFKIEGSKSGKLKATAVAVRYVADSKVDMEKGGTFTVERSRVEGLKINDTVVLGEAKTITAALNRIKELNKLRPLFNGEVITQSDFTSATKNSRDLWIRQFKDTLLDLDVIEGIHYLILKDGYLNMLKGTV